MELKEYQSAALDAFERWRDELERARADSAKRAAALKSVGVEVSDDDLDFPKTAWQKLAEAGGVARTAGEYVSRKDDAGRHIPHACFKVPTGGGKTLLAAAALARMNRQTGLTLWVTPTKAIYKQTKDALANREHPYRQMLERASGGRVKLLEKDDRFTPADVANQMCVMLLMLPAANRKKSKEFLRMFRDSGRYIEFFPDEDDPLGNGRLLSAYPDLELTSASGHVKQSLFNLLKMLRPAVVLDEAHKAYGKARRVREEFARSVNRLDPSIVIELSATPIPDISNLLVDIDGVALKKEEMIKLPVQVTSLVNSDWKRALTAARDKMEELAGEARALQQSNGVYIRPIAVVRVERTGKNQRDGERIHAEDAREFLIRNLNVPADAIRVKSTTLDELGDEDLLSEFSAVRWIITKDALKEGWDCPFAYALVMLDNTRAQTAITQLVGRVMRQPHARRTGRELLDQCYVFCLNRNVGAAVEQVKRGLENEGFTGLGDAVFGESEQAPRRRVVRRRERFQNQDIFLPKVLHRDGGGWTELDYQRHILPAIGWNDIDAPLDIQSAAPEAAAVYSASVDLGDGAPLYRAARDLDIDKTIRISWFARRLADIVPNPWQAARVSATMLQRLRDAGQSDDDIFDSRAHLAQTLRDCVAEAVEKKAECAFRNKLDRGEISFDLQTDKPNYRMVDSYEIPIPADSSGLFGREDGQLAQLNLFEPVYERQFDTCLEKSFASYLDEQKALKWWHRVAVGQRDGYYLRGWKRERVWPDFVCMGGERDGVPRVMLFETKGEHLRGNADTEYKRRLLETLENAYGCGTMTVKCGPAKGVFRLVFDKRDFAASLAPLEDVYTA